MAFDSKELINEQIVLAKLLSDREYEFYQDNYGWLHHKPHYMSKNDIQSLRDIENPELNKKEQEEVAKALMLFSPETIMSLNNDGVFTVSPIRYESGNISLLKYDVSLNPDTVISKANFKELVKIGKKEAARPWLDDTFNKNKMTIDFNDIPKLFEINRKTLKYSQEDLTTILENRLDGTYRDKFDDGKTWNKDGIGERLGTWGGPRDEAPAPKPVQFEGIAQIQPASTPATQSVPVSALAQPQLSQKELDDGLKQAYSDKNYKDMDSWLARGADVDYQWGYFLEHASATGDLEAVNVLVKHNATLSNMEGKKELWPAYEEFHDYLEDERNGALHMAASGNHYEIVKTLIEAGADVNEMSAYQGFALGAAAENGNIDMVKLLVENGADVNRSHNDRSAALTGALSGEHYDVATYLLDNGANPGDVMYGVKGSVKANVRAFLAEYRDAEQQPVSLIDDITKRLNDTEQQFSASHSDIKHFHYQNLKDNDNAYVAHQREHFQTYGTNRESGKIEYLADSGITIGPAQETTLGDSLDKPNVYSYRNETAEKNALGLEYKDTIRGMLANVQQSIDFNSNNQYKFEVLRFTTDEIKGDVRFMSEMFNTYPDLVTKKDLSAPLQAEVGDNQPQQYLNKKTRMLNLEIKASNTYDKPAQKLAKETLAKPKSADSESDWESGKPKSMEEAQALMKANRERRIGTTPKL